MKLATDATIAAVRRRISQTLRESRLPENGRRALRAAMINSAIRLRRVDGRKRPLPDFIIVGAQKAGTSALFDYIAQHPGVRGSLVKEVHFFDINYHHGLEWYRAFFPTRGDSGDFIVGEASPYYMFHPHAVRRIANDIPDVKLLVSLRNPVDRAYSHYQMERSRRFEPLPSFWEALQAEGSRVPPEAERLGRHPTATSFPHQRFSYLSRGRYAEQVSVILDLFPRDRLKFIKAERLRADPQEVLTDVYRFLGLPARPVRPLPPDTYVRNYSSMSPRDRVWLNEYFAPHNRELARLLGPDFRW